MKQRILLKNILLTGSYGSYYFIAQLNEVIKEDCGSGAMKSIENVLINN